MVLLVVYLVLLTRLMQAQYLEELAQEKPTKQSGSETYAYSGNVFNGTSSFAVDRKPVIGLNQTCSKTAKSLGPWWMVDLQEVYLIKEVAIQPRPKTCVMSNFTISVSQFWDASTDQMVNPTRCYVDKGSLPHGTRTVFSCVESAMGRYLKLSMIPKKPKAICICELEVFGITNERFFEYRSRPGKRSTNRSIQTIDAPSPTVCSAYCREHLDCTSFNMAAVGGVCELIADPLGNLHGNEVPEPGWTRYIFR